MRMSYRCKTELDAELFAELVEFSGGEVAPIVNKDVVRDAESTGDALEELDGCNGRLVGDGDGLYPLGEFVDCCQKMCVSTRR